MAKYVIDDSTLTAIANNIRLKKRTTDFITPEDMPAEIASIESGGGDDGVDKLVSNTMSSLKSNATSVRQYAFRGATALVSVDLPKATSVATNAFYGCTKLTSVNMPLVKSIGDNAFNNCTALTSIVLPSLTTGAGYAFRYGNKLATIDLHVITNIVAQMFYECRGLKTLILRSPTMCTLANTNAFTNCYKMLGTTNSSYNPNGEQGYVYVPSALKSQYESAATWTNFKFRAIEDYPEICG